MMRGGWILAVVMASLPGFALAQGAQVPFGGLSHDSSLPVEITSDRLDLDQAAGSAVFSGTVKVGQGTLRLAADTVEVFYDTASAAKGSAPPGAGAKADKPASAPDTALASTGKITRLIATGHVTLANGTEAAEANSATYEVAAGTIVMQGDVLLTQGQNALSSQTLNIDLNKGTGQLEGRVQTIFVPSAAPPKAGARPAAGASAQPSAKP